MRRARPNDELHKLEAAKYERLRAELGVLVEQFEKMPGYRPNRDAPEPTTQESAEKYMDWVHEHSYAPKWMRLYLADVQNAHWTPGNAAPYSIGFAAVGYLGSLAVAKAAISDPKLQHAISAAVAALCIFMGVRNYYQTRYVDDTANYPHHGLWEPAAGNSHYGGAPSVAGMVIVLAALVVLLILGLIKLRLNAKVICSGNIRCHRKSRETAMRNFGPNSRKKPSNFV